MATLPAVAGPISATSDEAAYRFEGDTYALAIHRDGRVGLYGRHGGEDSLLGTIGAFEMPACDVTSGPILSVNRFRKTIPASDKVHVENVATALQATDSGFPEVYVDYRCEKGALATFWTLMPRTVHMSFRVTPAEGVPRSEGAATLKVSSRSMC